MYKKVYQTRSSIAKEKVKYVIWTNEMDRCLSEVLAEYSRKGSRSDGIIKPTTYAAAVEVLKKKFGLDLNKDHIKNRLKTWRKQYGLLKEILAQKGFKWDRVRKMVVADDFVWRNYIKINPDAKHFRAKFIENYDELCSIVGDDQATTNFSDKGAAFDVDLSFEDEGVDNLAMSDIWEEDKQAKNLRWTEEMDCCLAKFLVDQVQKGYIVDSFLQPRVYDTVLKALQENFGPGLCKDHIKNRLKTWKKHYGVLKELLSQAGFKWDEAQKMVVGSDALWTEYIEVHPDAKRFRGKVVENLNDFRIIFGNRCILEGSCRNDDDFLVLTPDNEDVEATDTVQIYSSCMNEKVENMIWTNEMDSYLSNILVKQEKDGNKLDCLFKSAVCADAAIALNKEFQLELTKDHIRNRLNTWKKQYVILKDLLYQDGFQWDGTEKMVVADDSKWDDYIKKHHEVKPFRGRVIENYDQLSVLFSLNDATGSYSRTADDIVHNMASDTEGMDAIYVKPIRFFRGMKDQAKNLRWTNEVDRCLSRILVEQVILGNKSKLDNEFKPVAYDVAASALSERFELEFTNEHVKSRIKMWKKLYGTVKELIYQCEFRWDEKRKMITADDSVWCDYIKANPDVRLIKGRVIEIYAELCIIFGNDNPNEGSASDAEADLDWAVNNHGLGIEVCDNRVHNEKDKGSYVIWTEEMDNCLTEKLIEHVEKGNKLAKNFKPVAYAAALKDLKVNFGLDLTKSSISNRLKTWKKLYGLVEEVLSHRGFEWDEKRHMIIAEDTVWKQYIQRHPDAKFLWARPIGNYDKLHVIFGDDNATPLWSETKAKCEVNHTSNDEEHLEEMSQYYSDDRTQGSSQRTRARTSSSSQFKQPHKKRSISDRMVEMMSAIAANIGRIADALSVNNQSVCLDDLFEMVQNIPGFDDDLIVEACEFLSSDERRAKMFLKLDERLRKLWLLKRLRGSSS